MSSLTGEFNCKLDDKGRLTLPTRLKNALPDEHEGKVVLRKGFEPYIIIYPYSSWLKVYGGISQLNEFDPKHRLLKRMFMRGVQEVEIDKSGRLNIPNILLEHAGLRKSATLMAVGDQIEVWDTDEFNSRFSDDEVDVSALAGELFRKGELSADLHSAMAK